MSPHLRDPEVNIQVGTAYMRVLANRFDGATEKVVAGYNVGPTWIVDGRRLPGDKTL